MCGLSAWAKPAKRNESPMCRTAVFGGMGRALTSVALLAPGEAAVAGGPSDGPAAVAGDIGALAPSRPPGATGSAPDVRLPAPEQAASPIATAAAIPET